MSFCFFVLVVVSVSIASSNEIALNLRISNEDKKSFSKGERIILDFSIDRACSDFGYLMGAIEFDDNSVEFIKALKESMVIHDDLTNFDDHIQAKIFDIGTNSNKNCFVFWIEDQQNRIKTGKIGQIAFDVKKDVKNVYELFNIKRVEASDYNLSNTYSVSFNNDVSNDIEKTNDDISNLIDDMKNELDGKNKILNISSTTSKPKKNTIWNISSQWAINELEKASDNNLIPSSLNGLDFTKAISRKHFAAVSVKLYEYFSGKEFKTTIPNPFTDVNDLYVLKAYEIGITKGVSDNSFSPDSEITREQMATMIYRTLEKAGIDTKIDLSKVEKFVDDNEIHSWGKDAIYYMSNKGIIKGISTKENRFGVLNNATIEQAIAISLRCVETLK